MKIDSDKHYLDAAGYAWFSSLKNQYLTCSPQPSDSRDNSVRIKVIIEKDRGQVNVQDLFDLEDYILSILSPEELAVRLKAIRRECKEAFGEESWGEILPTLIENIENDNRNSNLIEARSLQAELHWQASIRMWAQGVQLTMMLWVIAILAIVLVVVNLAPYLYFPLHAVLFTAGVAGGCVGTLQRIHSANLATAKAFQIARYSWSFVSVIISPLLGGVFALVLTALLISGIMTPGLVVPNITAVSYNDEGGRAPSSTNRYSKSSASNLGKSTNRFNFGGSNSVEMIRSGGGNAEVLDAAHTRETGEKVPDGNGESREPLGCICPFLNLGLCFKSGRDLVLLVLLAFISGFSERLIPDMLTQLERVQKKTSM